MTACNDVQNNSLGKKAVSAALMGTLAVGMVPATALAATAPEANDGIETLTATIADEFKNAAISQVKINGGAAEATPTGKIEIALGTTNAGVVPTQLTSAITGGTMDVFQADGSIVDGLKIAYTNADGDPVAEADIQKTVGTYSVQVVSSGATLSDGTTDNPYDGLASAKVSFKIVGKSLTGATLYEINPDALSNVSDTTFTYNGGSQSIGVALNGAPLNVYAATDDSNTPADETKGDYSVTFYDANGGTVASVDNAGTYRAVIKGYNQYAGSEEQVTFTVEKLDLSTADIALKDVSTAAPAAAPYTTSLASVNGMDATNAKGDPNPNVTAINDALNFDYSKVATETGTYSVTLTPKSGNSTAAKNITGTKTLSYNVVASDEIYVEYNKAAFANMPIDLSQGESFNASAIKVYAGKTAAGEPLTAGQYTITVTDQDGKTVPTSSLSTPGKWNVTVAVDSAAMDYALGGKKTAVVTVTNGTIKGAEMFVTYDGKAAKAFNKTYTGQNYLNDVAVKVVSGDKTLVEGTDYKVTYTNSKGEEVTEFTNADTYKVTITSDTWTVTTADDANICVFEVSPIKLNASDLLVAGQVKITKEEGKVTTTYEGLPYTGKEITPTFEYATVDSDGQPVLDAKKQPVYAALPATAYKISSIAGVAGTATANAKSILAVGDYKVTLADNADDPNFEITNDAAIDVTVIDEKVFADVPTDAWYAQVVAEAAEAGYMSGYAGTNLFGPNDKITRAQVACVLFNMAGGNKGDLIVGGDDNSSTIIGNEYTSFADVNPKAYYAQAVAWAKDTGVVNGFAGTDNFGPDQLVTREQFACMLWNYAKATLSTTVKDVDVEAALASMPDGSKVSDWAKDGVAWAVQNKVIGNGGVIDPMSKVTRAEAAAMAVNFQPYEG